MRLSALFLTLAQFLLPPALIGTVYLYLYPAVQQCSFPPAKRAEAACYFDGSSKPAVPAETAPFRLLALGDPQLEGDTSLPADLAKGYFPSAKEGFWHGVQQCGDSERVWCGVRPAVVGLLKQDVPRWLRSCRKKVDLWGNDLYLAHIYWLMSWWTQPTHTVVLGDLLGSQWIGDDEFQRRSERFWGKVFKGAERVPRDVTDVSGRWEVLGQDERWRRRVIAVAGNHDIGYAGDVDEHRTERFEEAYGRVNWEVRFRLNDSSGGVARSPALFLSSLVEAPPELRLVILNSMNLDEPVYKPELRQQTLDFLAEQLHSPSEPPSGNSATILLTHIPLHKEAGTCADGPFFSYFPAHEGGGIREQNHLSEEMSDHLLSGLLGGGDEGASAIVLNGHDHEGCDTFHRPLDTPTSAGNTDRDVDDAAEAKRPRHWQAEKFHPRHAHRDDGGAGGLREITVRSMMGSYGGNAGLLSAWFDDVDGRWRFEYGACMLGVQHVWWAVHVLDLVVLGLAVAGVGLTIREELAAVRAEASNDRQGDKTIKAKKA